MKKFILIAVAACIAIVSFRDKEITITGDIKDELGSPVPFATILEKGTRNATTADANGYYKITVDGQQKYLRVASVGYDAQEIEINNRTIINVVMKKMNTDLNCLIVVTTGRPVYLAMPTQGYSQNKPVNNDYNTEEYSNIAENGFKKVADEPLSTFSIDVDAASYSNVRRYLNDGQLPPVGAVRIEEMINYFTYQYPQPTGDNPFSINTEISVCPWNKKNRLVLIGLQGKIISQQHLPASNLVFLIDVSGSMFEQNKLPLVKASLKLLTDQLRENDHISIVVYAGNAGLVLPSTGGGDKIKIKTAIDGLEAGGSTAGGEGIQLAYKIAQQNFMQKGNNRIILCTDGDFNVGASSDDDLVRLIEKERNKGIYISVLGFGMGNYKDSKMEQIADKGNGNYAYIDGINEAKKVLVKEFGGTLFTIAKDVKLQVEFNPNKVAGYRLIGYEDRLLNKEDFNDDKKDAGELGSGHTVTALYEIIPAGVKSPFLKNIDPLKYQKPGIAIAAYEQEILTVKFRYKVPSKEESELIVHPVPDNIKAYESTSDNFRFASAVADFAMLLRNSEYKGNNSFQQVISLANASLGKDSEGYRKEFVSLVKKAAVLQTGTAQIRNK
jgi:Ca-activated chloride channel family protein